MSFTSQTARYLFHLLPTQVQLDYEKFAQALAKDGRTLACESVMTIDNDLEILIRITEKLDIL